MLSKGAAGAHFAQVPLSVSVDFLDRLQVVEVVVLNLVHTYGFHHVSMYLVFKFIFTCSKESLLSHLIVWISLDKVGLLNLLSQLSPPSLLHLHERVIHLVTLCDNLFIFHLERSFLWDRLYVELRARYRWGGL